MKAIKIHDIETAKSNVSLNKWVFADLLAQKEWTINKKKVSVDLSSHCTKDPEVSGGKTTFTVYIDGEKNEHMDIAKLKTRLSVAGGGKPRANGRINEKIRLALKVLKWCAEHPEQAVKTYNLHLQCTENKSIKEKVENERTRLKASGYSENTINIFIAEFEDNLRKNNDTQQL